MTDRNNNIPVAIGFDPLAKKGFFYSDNLSYITSTLILQKGISIEYVVPHPKKPNVKLYYLSPEKEARKTYQDFTANKLKVNPQELSLQIGVVRNLSFSTPDEIKRLNNNVASPTAKFPEAKMP